MAESKDTIKKVAVVSFSEFLEACPPSQLMHISDIATRRLEGSGPSFKLSTPELLLHCSSEICNGNRIFRSKTNEYFSTDEYREVFLKYTCSNCQKTERIYAIAFIRNSNSDLSGHAFKYGEVPPFGPPTPSRLITMIGPDRENFLKGRRCENQGLGIGAFIYYRRVVENQKNRILNEIIKVATKIGDDASKIELLNRAIMETQFTKAMDMIKDAVPRSLLIDGNNPLTLLHKALSKGVHNNDDDECLNLAESVRIVMGELAEKIAMVLKDEAEIKKALSRLK